MFPVSMWGIVIGYMWAFHLNCALKAYKRLKEAAYLHYPIPD